MITISKIQPREQRHEKLGLRNPYVDQALDLARGPFAVEGSDQLEALATFLRRPDRGSRLELEHLGVDSSLVTLLGRRLGIRLGRLKQILGMPLNARLPAPGSDARIHGGPAFAALALVELLGSAMAIVEASTSPKARDFDTAKWLGDWIERPHRAISDVRPSQIIALPTGLPVLLQMIGAIQSGVYL